MCDAHERSGLSLVAGRTVQGADAGQVSTTTVSRQAASGAGSREISSRPPE